MYDKIKAIATEKGMTIEEVEKKAGLSNGTIGKWRKSNKGVWVSSAKAVADALEVGIEELVK